MILIYIFLLLNNAERIQSFSQNPKIAKSLLKISKSKSNGIFEEATHRGNINRECVLEICDFEEYTEGTGRRNMPINADIKREYTNLKRGLIGYDWMERRFCEIDPCDKNGTSFCTEIWSGRVCSCKLG